MPCPVFYSLSVLMPTRRVANHSFFAAEQRGLRNEVRFKL